MYHQKIKNPKLFDEIYRAVFDSTPTFIRWTASTGAKIASL